MITLLKQKIRSTRYFSNKMMNIYRWALSGFIGFIIVFNVLGCKNEDELLQKCTKPVEIDAAGLWSGSYQSDNGEYSGTFLADVIQNDAILTGNYGIYHDAGSFSDKLNASVCGNEIHVEIEYDNMPIICSATVMNDMIEDGRFSFSSIQGTWTGEKLPAPVYETELVGEPIEAPGQHPGKITSDGQYLCLVDSYDSKIYQINFNGQVINSFISEDSSNSHIAINGNEILLGQDWTNKIKRLSANDGSYIEEIETNFNVRNVTCYDGSIYVSTSFPENKIHEIDITGATLSEIDLSYNFDEFVYDGEYFWTNSFTFPAFLKFSLAGKLIAVHRLPNYFHQKNIIFWGEFTYGAQYFWALIEEIIEIPSDSLLVKLVKFQLSE